MPDSTPCPRCGGTGTNQMYGHSCANCDGSGLKVNPKMRGECECGAKQPRFSTAYTAAKWMRGHLSIAHRYDAGDA